MKKLILFIYIMSMACWSCKNNIDINLDKAEAIIEEHPDSAYRLISETAWKDIKSKNQKARYGLIATQALNMLYEYPESDSLIDTALDYYDRPNVKDPERLAKSLYYKSLSKDRQNHYIQAIAYAIRARDMADSLKIDMLAGRAWKSLGNIYSHSFDYYHSINAYRQSADRFKKANAQHHYQYAIMDMAMLMGAYGKAENGINVLDSLWTDNTPYNEDTKDFSNLIYALLYNQSDEPFNALSHLDSIPQKSAYHNDPIEIKQYLEVRIPPLIETGQFKEADSLINLLTEPGQEDSFELLEIKSQYFKAIAQKDSALYYLQAHTDKLYDVIREAMANSALSAGVDYYKEIYRDKLREQEESRREFNRTARAILLVLLWAGYLVWRKIRRQKHELAQRMDEIAILSEDSANTYRLMDDLKESLARNDEQSNEIRRLENLYKQQYSRIDSLIKSGIDTASIAGEKYFKNFYSVAKAILSKENIARLEEEINRSNGGILAELRTACPFVNDEMMTVFVLTIRGFAVKTISIVVGKNPGTIYTAVSRTRARIAESDWPRAEEFGNLFRRREADSDPTEKE